MGTFPENKNEKIELTLLQIAEISGPAQKKETKGI